MAKRPTYTQRRAKKSWLLHTSSSCRKFKSKRRIPSPKVLRRSVSVGNEHINSAQKRTIFHGLTQLKGLYQSDSETEETLKVYDLHQKPKWLSFAGLGDIVNFPVNMAFGAMMNGAHYVRHCFQETCKTIENLNKTLNTGIRHSFQSVESYQRKFMQCTTAVFQLSNKRKFEELNGRINDLEIEIKKLKTFHSETLCTHCQCHQEHGSLKPNLSSVQFQVAPPPPPPPPIPPPPAFLHITKKSNTSTSHAKPCAVKEVHKAAAVSLQDIKSVKLRKVFKATNSVTRSPLKEITGNSNMKQINGRPLITMKDLMGVKLKRKSTNSQQVKTPENHMMVLRRNLRKVSHQRSPGGTPMNKTPIEDSGVGLTPMITRALKKKFELANPPSVSPQDSSSPRRKSRALTLSPVQATPSPSSPVILSFR